MPKTMPRAGRPVGLRLPSPQNPKRVARILSLRDTQDLSYQAIADREGISRVAVRLQYVRWKDDPWRKTLPEGFGFVSSELPKVVSPHAAD